MVLQSFYPELGINSEAIVFSSCLPNEWHAILDLKCVPFLPQMTQALDTGQHVHYGSPFQLLCQETPLFFFHFHNEKWKWAVFISFSWTSPAYMQPSLRLCILHDAVLQPRENICLISCCSPCSEGLLVLLLPCSKEHEWGRQAVAKAAPCNQLFQASSRSGCGWTCNASKGKEKREGLRMWYHTLVLKTRKLPEITETSTTPEPRDG